MSQVGAGANVEEVSVIDLTAGDEPIIASPAAVYGVCLCNDDDDCCSSCPAVTVPRQWVTWKRKSLVCRYAEWAEWKRQRTSCGSEMASEFGREMARAG